MSSVAEMINDGERLRSRGDLVAAETAFRRVLNIQPTAHAAWHGLGLVAHACGKNERAAELVGKALKLDQSKPVYYRNLGELNRLNGKAQVAVQMAREAIRLSAGDPDSHYNLALALSDCGDDHDAEAAYRQAIQLAPKHNYAWNNLGAILENRGHKSDALKAYRRAIAINPQHAEAQNNAGALESEAGDLDQAKQSFQAAIAARPQFAEAHHNLSTLKTYNPDDPHLAMLEELSLRPDLLDQDQRIRLFFALGKARSDAGYHDAAFIAYAEGNRLKRATLNYDTQATNHLADAIIKRFNQPFLSKRSGQGAADQTPIFIIGMPRSGTTLVEQILASHGQVFGAGELTDFHDCFKAAGEGRRMTDPSPWIEAMTLDQWRDVGATYIQQIQALGPGAGRITDKMPGNYHYLGAIHLALPQARIVHVRRDPMDSLWSNFTRLFTQTMEFAYDLDDLAHAYRTYVRLMQHWRAVLPKNVLYEIVYEKLVRDLKGETRQMLDFLDLDFEPACLAFHENRRKVRTASVAQVRKPIYTSSIGRWKPYAKRLAPLLKAIRS